MSPDASHFQDESKPDCNGQGPLSLIEKWLLDEGTQGKDYLSGDVTIYENNLL
uniref:Uncharacterized protein n=1 Tax=Rhizophora mucronata TaxID=61149 RepID=A0A2P2PMH7_RHIMU